MPSGTAPRKHFTLRVGSGNGITPCQVWLGVLQLEPSPDLAAQLKSSGYDFVFIDREHGSFNWSDTVDGIAAARAAGLIALVRIENRNEELAKQIAELEPDAVIVPQIEDPATAAGLARRLDPHSHAALIVVLESRLGTKRAKAIAATPGVAAVLLGPRDLSRDLGHDGDYSSSDFLKAVEMIESAALVAGKLLGSAPYGLHDARQLLDRGHRLIVLGTDRAFRNGALAKPYAEARTHAASRAAKHCLLETARLAGPPDNQAA